MALQNYSDLKFSLEAWLNRADLVERVPDFISLAEGAMNRRLRHWRMVSTVELELTGRRTDLPDGWLEGVSVAVNVNPVALPDLISFEEMILKRREINYSTPQDWYYTQIGGQLELFPIPQDDTTAEVSFYKAITPLSGTDITNWVLQYNPDLYLYGALRHSAPYLKNDPRLTIWDGLYEQALVELNLESVASSASGNTPRGRRRSYG